MSTNGNKVQASPFRHAEAEFAKLRSSTDAGDLSEADLKQRMHDLMVQDAHGQWWVIGFATGAWYVHTGEEWVQRTPPGAESARAGESLGNTLWWPALLVGLAFAFSRDVSRLLSTVFAGCGFCHFEIPAWQFNLCLQENCGWKAMSSEAGFFGFTSGLLIALIVRFFYPSLTWLHIAVIAVGWGVMLALFQIR